MVWLRRDEVNQEPLLKKDKQNSSARHENYKNMSFEDIGPADDGSDSSTAVDSSAIWEQSAKGRKARKGILKKHHGDKSKQRRRRGATYKGGGTKKEENDKSTEEKQRKKQESLEMSVIENCRKEQALAYRKEIVVEWQTIATVIDRLLFWLFLFATVIAYLVILVFVPWTKPEFPNDLPAIHAFIKTSPHTQGM